MASELQKHRLPAPAHPFFASANLGRIFRTARMLKTLKGSIGIIGANTIVQSPAKAFRKLGNPVVLLASNRHPVKEKSTIPPVSETIDSPPEIHPIIAPLTIPPPSGSTQKKNLENEDEVAAKSPPFESNQTIHPALEIASAKKKKRLKSHTQPTPEQDQSHEIQ